MRRRHAHTIFALTTAACAALLAYHAVQLVRATRVNASIANATTVKADLAIPEARFAYALALSRSGQADAALAAYKPLVQGPRADLRVAALFNVGNLHMREAQAKGLDDPAQSQALIELAKQSYRDALRIAARDWDTRYNLEQALRLAPEDDEMFAEDDEQENEEERVMSTVQGVRMDLP